MWLCGDFVLHTCLPLMFLSGVGCGACVDSEKWVLSQPVGKVA